MIAKDLLKKLREVRETFLATVDEDGDPQARLIETMLVDDDALYFLTARGKNVYKEIMNHNRVVMAGLTKDWMSIRVNGTCEKLDDKKYWIDKMFKNNPSMDGIYPGESRYILEPFKILSGVIEYFDLSGEKINRGSVSVGAIKVKEKGFFITNSCIECGACARNCPQQAITLGTPYFINQENCLHCSLCFEKCPVSAIKRI